jgi:yjbE family integral membrane protein
MIMDSALFITGLFAMISAITTAFSANQAIGYGLITLLLVGLVGGVAFYFMYYFVYRYYGPDMERSQRPPFWKSVLVILASMVLWLAVFFGTSFLPAALNPILAPLPLAILGAALLALRFYLKKRFNIRSASAGPSRY